MKQAPNIWNLRALFEHCKCGTLTESKGKWVPARPLAIDCIEQRIKAAWLAFTGEADVVKWP